MKKNPILSLSLLLVFTLGPVTGKAQESEIKKIRDQYNLIEGYETVTSTTSFEAEDDPTAGQITRYYYKEKLVKVAVEWGAEHGGSAETFYYHDGKLIFVFKADSLWRFTGKTKPDGESETIDTLKEYRLYFKDGKCLRSLFKEAKNTNAALLDDQIAEVANAALNDPKLNEDVAKRGVAWYKLFTESAIRKVFGD